MYQNEVNPSSNLTGNLTTDSGYIKGLVRSMIVSMYMFIRWDVSTHWEPEYPKIAVILYMEPWLQQGEKQSKHFFFTVALPFQQVVLC